MITKSAQKAHRQSLRKHAQNLQRKEALRDVLKNYKKLVSAKNMELAQSELAKVYKALDKAAKVNLIKDNKASRLKSRLSKLLVLKA